MTPAAHAEALFSSYEEYRLDHLRPANCKHANVIAEVRMLAAQSDGILTIENIGRSLEGREIAMVSAGSGDKTVLLWSQMHGDESTATLALLDMFHLLVRRTSTESWLRELLSQTRICAIPLLNPDGAETVRRHTAVQIDMNRDARELATPEARILREAQRRLQPAFGFNLHDQALSSVGDSARVAVLALLAPAADEAKTVNPVRMRAFRVGALIARSLNQFVQGHLATYDDAFEPRAFGDRMQSWGTSTVLIESGHWPRDREKKFVRKLNYVALLTALRAIGNGSYQDVELDHYTNLPPNGKRVYDYIIRGVTLTHPRGWASNADIGLLVDPVNNRENEGDNQGTLRAMVTVKEIGDLSTHGGLETIDARGRTLQATSFSIDQVIPLETLLDVLQTYHAT